MTPNTIFILAPQAGSILTCSSGRTYTANAQGFLTTETQNIPTPDKLDLLSMGCLTYAVSHVGHVCMMDLSVVGDHPLPVRIPTGVKFRVSRVMAINASSTPTGVTGKIFSLPDQGGVQVADLAGAVGCSTPDTVVSLPLLSGMTAIHWSEGSDNNFYANVVTPAPDGCKVDLYVYADIYWPNIGMPAPVPVAGTVWDQGRTTWDGGQTTWDQRAMKEQQVEERNAAIAVADEARDAEAAELEKPAPAPAAATKPATPNPSNTKPGSR